MKPPIVKYNPIFVNDMWILPNIGASKLKKFLISNWSNGLDISKSKLYFIIIILNKFNLFYRKDKKRQYKTIQYKTIQDKKRQYKTRPLT